MKSNNEFAPVAIDPANVIGTNGTSDRVLVPDNSDLIRKERLDRILDKKPKISCYPKILPRQSELMNELVGENLSGRSWVIDIERTQDGRYQIEAGENLELPPDEEREHDSFGIIAVLSKAGAANQIDLHKWLASHSGDRSSEGVWTRKVRKSDGTRWVSALELIESLVPEPTK